MARPKLILIDDGEEDSWGRHLYRELYTGKIYVEVDGVLHSRTAQGEPSGKLKYQFGKGAIVKDNK